MNQFTVEQMETHVKVLGWLHIVANAILFVVGIFVLILLWGIGFASGDAEALRVLAIVGTSVAGLLALLGIPGVVAGIGLLARKQWGRVLALVVGFLGLLNFPIGTAIGIYTGYVLLQDAANEYFAG